MVALLWQETFAAATRKRVFALCLVAALGACERERSPAPATLGDKTMPEVTKPSAHAPEIDVPVGACKVLFLGDSISAGLHLPEAEAFPARLQQRLHAQGHTFALTNAGVSGDTSAGGLSRLPWLLKSAPDIVVVELGGNDGLRGMPVATTEKNLRAILASLAEHGVRALLLGMRIPPSYGEPYASEFAALYARIASDTGVAFVPFFMEGVAGVPTLNLSDGLHPTADGHERLSARLEAPLASLISEVMRARRDAGAP